MRVLIRDDGVGLKPDMPTTGFGLQGMRERVELLGGKLTIASAPGAGTTIAASLPVTRVGQHPSQRRQLVDDAI